MQNLKNEVDKAVKRNNQIYQEHFKNTYEHMKKLIESGNRNEKTG